MSFKNIFESYHGLDFERVKNSHRKKHGHYFKNGGSAEEALEMIRDFVQKEYSPGYCQSVMTTLFFDIRRKNPAYKQPISFGKIHSAYRTTRKLIDSVKRGETLYDGQGRKIPTNQKLANFHLNLGATTFLDSEEADALLRHAKETLKNFLADRSCPYSIQVELALMLIILDSTGLRKGELLKMTMKEADELILSQETILPTKTGFRPICFGTKTSQMLYDVFNHPSRRGYDFVGESSENRALLHSYKKLRAEYIKTYQSVLGKKKPKGSLFHVFRSRFTEKACNINPTITQHALNHRSGKTTRRYQQNQLLKDLSMRKKLMNRVE